MIESDVPQAALFKSLQLFAEQLTSKFSALSAGEPEDQLKAPVDNLFQAFGKLTTQTIILKGESTLKERLGRPDFAAHCGILPIGYIELKAPGKGANPLLYKSHDYSQWLRFKNVPNLIYTDGNEWALYQDGELAEKRIRLNGDIRTDGKAAVTVENAIELFQIFAAFTSWVPIVPKKAKAIAAFLAPFCHLIREEVLDALRDSQSLMHSLKREIKELLFPDADDFQFADAYAQTVIFALLLGQMEGADVLDLRNVYEILENHHSLLSRSLEFLTDKEARQEISASLCMAQRVIHEIPQETLEAASPIEDPWLFFYEDFLAAYDRKLRKQSGVYFTPLEVVRCQIRLADEILTKYLGKKMGFADAGVITLDPATGTGTYLLGIIEHSLDRIAKEEGPGAVKGGARLLSQNLYGFEWMVGPYSVAQLRLSQALTKHGISLPPSGLGIYLTNTLESPHTIPAMPALFHKPIAIEHEKALTIKDKIQVLVCIGNPPYGRHEAKTSDNKATTGGWVRFGDEKDPNLPILKDFLEPAQKCAFGKYLKNIYNLYVYFIRWSLWKVFEHTTATGPGILTFITASSYLDGVAFVGLREHMRKICDNIDIIDLGGEARGPRADENVFSIQTPVAIFIAWRKAKASKDFPATVRYARIEGSKEEKLKMLDTITSYNHLQWQSVSNDWQASFLPLTQSEFNIWPSLVDLLPWQSPGIECKRIWPIAPSKELLERRWDKLLNSPNRRISMKENGDRTIFLSHPDLFDHSEILPPIEMLAKNQKVHKIIRYAYRSFDRQYLIGDNRLISRPRPPLWQAHSDQQIYLICLFTIPLSIGPAMTICSDLPDCDCFRGSYAGKAMPLFRDSDCKQLNILLGLLEILHNQYHKEISPEDFASYIYAILAHPEYTNKFQKELLHKEIRVPLTKDAKLFTQVSKLGRELIWLHTYGERLNDANHPIKQIPKGKARCMTAISDKPDKYPNDFYYNEDIETIRVGDGSFAPVSKEVWEFEVSGLKVVKSWLGYRMKKRSGKKSSPLDDIRPEVWTHEFTREFLELLWVLEHTVAGYEEQKKLFEEVLASELFRADELPLVPESARKAPKLSKNTSLFKEDDNDK